jgi:hypothetical protein
MVMGRAAATICPDYRLSPLALPLQHRDDMIRPKKNQFAKRMHFGGDT